MQTTHFQGKDGFIWWHGVVEDRKDPLFLGRCRVRILGWHTANKTELPTSDLPWAYPVMPITSASQTNAGEAPVGPVEGTWVMGYYRDGELAQEPVMMGTLPGIPENYAKQNTGFNDPRLDKIASTKHSISLQGPAKPGGGSISLTAWPYPPKTIEAKAGKEITIIEYSNEERQDLSSKSLYPRLKDEPTTSRYARGEGDDSSKVETEGIIAFKNTNLLNGKIITKHTPSSSLLTRLDESATTTVDVSTLTVELIENIQQPPSAYAAVYPFNHVYESESGHLIELDDTPTKERLHWYHRSGTFTEFHPKGIRTDRVMGHHYRAVTGNSETIINGKEKKIVGTSSVAAYGKTKRQTVGGDYIVTSESGNIMLSASAGSTVISGGNVLLDAANTLVLNAKQIIRSDDSAIDVIKGNYECKIRGSSITNSSALACNVMGPASFMMGQKEETITEGATTVLAGKHILLGGTITHEVKAVLGKIVMECTDAVKSGGVEMNCGPKGVAGQVAINPGGDVKMYAGPLAMSGVKIEGTKKVAIESAMAVEIEAGVGGVTVSSGSTGAVTVEGRAISLNGSTEVMILGTTFAKLFARHTHPSSVGPTGVTIQAQDISDCMSKKCFLG